MGLIDRHIRTARNRLTLGLLAEGLGWALLGWAAAVLVLVVLARLFSWPMEWRWIGVGAGLAVALAVGYALLRRPGEHEAAVAVDRELGLKEKFSTALYVREQGDEFARAAVRDAELTAQGVSLRGRFGVKVPHRIYLAAGVGVLALLAGNFIKPLDLSGLEQKKLARTEESIRQEEAKKVIREALARIESLPAEVAEDQKVREARRELEAMLQSPPKNPQQAQLAAQKAMQDVQEALQKKIAQSQSYADAQQDRKMLAALPPPVGQGPVAEAQRSLSEGDLSSADSHLQEAVNGFDKMSQAEQDQAIRQAEELAEQLRREADNPEARRQMEQKFQEMGATAEQARQMAQLMKQAAEGDERAKEQLEKMQRQLMDQMNNGQGPTPGQQEQIQQVMRQLQAQANSQAQAQKLAQQVQQLADAMRQCQNGAGSSSRRDSENLAQAQRAMGEQLRQMGQDQDKARQLADAQRATGGSGQPDSGGKMPGDGQGGPGQGSGKREMGEGSAGDYKAEHSPSQDQEGGKVLASTFVQGSSVKGESREKLRDVAESAQREQTDEIDQQRISRQSQETVKNYFSTMGEEEK